MLNSADPAIIFSNLTQDVVIDGHRFFVEIYRASDNPAWVLSVMNVFGTLTVLGDPQHFEDDLAWRTFERIMNGEGVRAFYTEEECRKLEY